MARERKGQEGGGDTPRVESDRELALRALMLLAVGGDEKAYGQLLRELTRLLRRRLSFQLQGHPDEVEDLVQDTLMAIHTHRHTYQPDLPLMAWVNAIARHRLIDHLRSRRRTTALHDPLDDFPDLAGPRSDEAEEARLDVEALLQQLPAHHRLPLLHTRLRGLSVAEASKVTGQSESAIKVGVHRGLKALAALVK